MIEIDGSFLEGGGQILRTSIALSAIIGAKIHIFNIRKGREKPGLRPQHCEGILAAAKICEAHVDGATINSLEVVFAPRAIHGGSFTIDTKTAGSVTLILQTLIPIGIFAKSPLHLRMRGGTAVPFSPPVDYLRAILSYYLGEIGARMSLEVTRHGFYPAGGGEITATISPSTITNFEIRERGVLKSIEARSIASTHLKNAKVAERMVDGFSTIVKNAHCTFEYVPSDSPGCFISAVALFEKSRLGASGLGRVGKRAEDVGTEAAQEIEAALESPAPIDSWMVDQILPFMALASYRTGAPSVVTIPELTQHAETNMWVIRKFLPVDFTIENRIITCSKIVDGH